MLYGGWETGANTKMREESGLFNIRCGVFHARARLEQRRGTQPLEEKELQIAQRRWMLRTSPRPGSRHESKCTHGRLACPAAESARKKNLPPENSKPENKGIFYIDSLRIIYNIY